MYADVYLQTSYCYLLVPVFSSRSNRKHAKPTCCCTLTASSSPDLRVSLNHNTHFHTHAFNPVGMRFSPVVLLVCLSVGVSATFAQFDNALRQEPISSDEPPAWISDPVRIASLPVGERLQGAELERYLVRNPEARNERCPWWVLRFVSSITGEERHVEAVDPVCARAIQEGGAGHVLPVSHV